MSEHEWTVKDVPAQPVEPERDYGATIEGLAVTLQERHPVGLPITVAWTVKGYLADITIYAYPATNVLGYDTTVEQAKEAAVAAAHRLYAVGVRGEKYEPSPYENATHIIAGTGFVAIESGQTGRYAVGELSRDGDPLPWKVVELKEGDAPVVIDGYVTREAAEAVRDEMNEMNGAAALWAASAVAREESRRVADASEQEGE